MKIINFRGDLTDISAKKEAMHVKGDVQLCGHRAGGKSRRDRLSAAVFKSK